MQWASQPLLFTCMGVDIGQHPSLDEEDEAPSYALVHIYSIAHDLASLTLLGIFRHYYHLLPHKLSGIHYKCHVFICLITSISLNLDINLQQHPVSSVGTR